MTLITTKDLVFNNMIEYPDMTIEKGKMTFIQGASGSGKAPFFAYSMPLLIPHKEPSITIR